MANAAIWPESRLKVPDCLRMFWNYPTEWIHSHLWTTIWRYLLHSVVRCSLNCMNLNFWLCMNHELEQFIQSCWICNQFRNNPWFHMVYHNNHGIKSELIYFISEERTNCYSLIIIQNTQKIVPLPDMRAKSTIAACNTVFRARHTITITIPKTSFDKN